MILRDSRQLVSMTRLRDELVSTRDLLITVLSLSREHGGLLPGYEEEVREVLAEVLEVLETLRKDSR